MEDYEEIKKHLDAIEERCGFNPNPWLKSEESGEIRSYTKQIRSWLERVYGGDDYMLGEDVDLRSQCPLCHAGSMVTHRFFLTAAVEIGERVPTPSCEVKVRACQGCYLIFINRSFFPSIMLAIKMSRSPKSLISSEEMPTTRKSGEEST